MQITSQIRESLDAPWWALRYASEQTPDLTGSPHNPPSTPGAHPMAIKARITELEQMVRELVKSGVTLEALLSDELTSVYIHHEVWSGLMEHRGNLRKALALLQPLATS